MAHKRISTIFKKWDLLITLEGNTCETALYIQTLREHHVSSALSLRVRNAHNERLYCSRAIHTSSNCRAHTST